MAPSPKSKAGKPSKVVKPKMEALKLAEGKLKSANNRLAKAQTELGEGLGMTLHFGRDARESAVQTTVPTPGPAPSCKPGALMGRCRHGGWGGQL